MQTIIMTVGTSLLTNDDRNLPDEQKRPWLRQPLIGDRDQAITWMSQQLNHNLSCLENFSAETNTLYRLDPGNNDKIILLYSDTEKGLDCAEVLKLFFEQTLDQKNIQLQKLPGINYDADKSSSALEEMSNLVQKLINNPDNVNPTLAATGGFKAQTMIMAIIGNLLQVPVCYIHEEFKGLIYLPYVGTDGKTQKMIARANLPESGVKRDRVINTSSVPHHRPRSWNKFAKELLKILWIDHVRFDKNAFSAPKNSVKKSPREVNVLWVHLYENDNTSMGIAVDTTALDIPEQEQAARVLRQILGNLL
ncbi:putative CRISPR-associated protein [Gloeocapsa sp. PCC 73106]|uniref:putative CRISPR-associated protein n=1 Tax=Gloeocapsa sp. PCC 73106 TaxID=102232 RepID=UPI0002ABBCA8|nr:putative CRISPR-associated protein [Gloeocapsa sp. PCC 73106]ELR99327.1 CRISPR-associated protein, APE2256 family [Gloeocapsa sp. PCC 73106]